MTIESLIDEAFESYSKKQFDKFEEKLAEILKLNDFRCIKKLVMLFDDDSNYFDVLFSVLHTIENFEDRIYTKEIIEILPELKDKSPEWGNIILNRIVNNKSTYDCFLKNLINVNYEKQEKIKAMLQLL